MRETSIWCIIFSVLNVFMPNSTFNIWIFGPDANDDDITGYSEYEKTNHDFLKVKLHLLTFLY